MTPEAFREKLEKSFGHKPFYFRGDQEVYAMTGLRPGTLANLDCKGFLKPFYVGKKAAYSTGDLIDFSVQRFSGSKA